MVNVESRVDPWPLPGAGGHPCFDLRMRPVASGPAYLPISSGSRVSSVMIRVLSGKRGMTRKSAFRG